MANNNMTETQRKLKENEAERLKLVRTSHIECDHTSGDRIIPVSDYNGVIRNRDQYTPTTVIHPECGAIFETAVFTPQEVEKAFFTIESMCHQIKLLTGANMDASKKKEISNCMENLDALHNNLGPYYNSMVKALSKTDNKQKRQERQVGGFGVTSGMFGRG